MSRSKPKPDINTAVSAQEAFDILCITHSKYDLQRSQGWIPVLVPQQDLASQTAFLSEQGYRFNPQPYDLDHQNGRPDGIWNAVCKVGKNSLYLIKDKRLAVRFKLIYG